MVSHQFMLLVYSTLEADELRLLRTVATSTMDFIRLLVDTVYLLNEENLENIDE